MTDLFLKLTQDFLQIHIALAPLISILIRTTSIVLAPIPGTPLDLLNLALFGKYAGFIYTETSIIVGSVINFWIAKRFGESVVQKFVPIEKIDFWEKKIEKGGGFFGLVLIRMTTAPIFDYMSYVAGLTKMGFWKFLSTSVLASIPPVFLFFYLGGTLIQKGFYWATFTISILILIFFLFRKGRILKKFSGYLNIKNKGDSNPDPEIK